MPKTFDAPNSWKHRPGITVKLSYDLFPRLYQFVRLPHVPAGKDSKGCTWEGWNGAGAKVMGNHSKGNTNHNVAYDEVYHEGDILEALAKLKNG